MSNKSRPRMGATKKKRMVKIVTIIIVIILVIAMTLPALMPLFL